MAGTKIVSASGTKKSKMREKNLRLFCCGAHSASGCAVSSLVNGEKLLSQ